MADSNQSASTKQLSAKQLKKLRRAEKTQARIDTGEIDVAQISKQREEKKPPKHKADQNSIEHTSKPQTKSPNVKIKSAEQELVVGSTLKPTKKHIASEEAPSRKKIDKQMNFFSHLDRYSYSLDFMNELGFDQKAIHPAFIRLGLQFASLNILGSTNRTLKFLDALETFLADYRCTPGVPLNRELEQRLKPNITFINQCRPMSISMDNAIHYLKDNISTLPSEKSESQLKILLEEMEKYKTRRIDMSVESASDIASKRISPGDVVLVYSDSSTVRSALKKAWQYGKGVRFSVVIIDSKPFYEGKKLLQFLRKLKIKCTYGLINTLSYIMPTISLVMVGASALFANGAVMSRVGTSSVALFARQYRKSFIVCCETLKFSERSQTDSIVYNELIDPDYLLPPELSDYWRSTSKIHMINCLYDVTPPELVSMVACEIGEVPAKSLAILVKLKYLNVQYD